MTPRPSNEYLRRVAAQNEADLASALYLRGFAYFAQGDTKAAAVDFETLLQLNVDDDTRQEVEQYLDLLSVFSPN